MNGPRFAFVLGFLLVVAVFDFALRPPEKRHRPLWIPAVATILFLGAVFGAAYLIAR